MRICKYKDCNNPVEAGTKKKYCNLKCYDNQQVLDQKKYREKRAAIKKANLPKRECKYEHCDNEIESRGRRQYCCPECRSKQTIINQKEKYDEERSIVKKKAKVDEKWLVRGDLSLSTSSSRMEA